MEVRVETRLAEMRLTMEGHLIEVHYREGMDLDQEGLMEVQLRRGELTRERCAMIAFFHAGTLSDVKVMNVDYFGLTNANEQLIALAIVTQDALGDAMSNVYYSYHPQTFPTRLFRSEKEAREWISEELART
jgi:arginyl-tRNA--protein-N-Asp/Glu arginylyltransferase